MQLRIGSRVFAPRVWSTLLTLLLLLVLLGLGRWQLQRADEKRVMYDAFAAGTGSTLKLDASSGPMNRYQHVETWGRYDPSSQILIDNMIAADGRAGYFVITPFRGEDGRWLLVNRGWIPLGASRAILPAVNVPADARRIHGRVDRLPRPGIRMGNTEALTPPFPLRAEFPQLAQIRAVLGNPAWTRSVELVLLDPKEPDGYLRQWAAPGMAPMRHIGYAVQWFALAAALLILYLVNSLKS